MGAAGRRLKKLKNIIGVLKDKTSLIKAAVVYPCNKTTSSIRMAVLRSTTHNPSSPPPSDRIDAVLSLGDNSRATACLCIEALMDRLHNTQNVAVALKCLIILHNIITRGSFILKDQFSFYPSAGGRNFLNLSTFKDNSDVDSWELSWWVRWYAVVLEHNLMASRVLGSYFSSSSKDNKEEKVSGVLNSVLMKETDVLVSFIDQICEAPNSLHLQKSNLVYEIVRLVSEDYGLTQHEIFVRVKEWEERIDNNNMSSTELTQLISGLKRLEECKERLMMLFVNRKRNDAFWDLISQTKVKFMVVKEEREERRMVIVRRKDESSELTRFGERVAGSGQLFRFTSGGGGLLDGNRVRLAVSTVR